MVKTKKLETGEDYVGNIFVDGIDQQQYEQFNQYKSLILHVGFDENKHGFLNPCQNIIEDKLPKYNERSSYKAMPFIPYDPIPPYPIYTTNIMLPADGIDLLTEDKKQSFTDDMVVEFRWENSLKQGWQWIPIRVRYDKTSEYQRKGKITCNAYTTAEGVWRSINKPITEKMITTGLDIPDVIDDNIYYDRSGIETNTQALRDFHNRYVKRKLIVGVSKRGDTLIDMSVGMGGDLQKWIDAKLSFVFGLDYSKDNIHNRIKGACARYLRMKKKYKTMPGALFIQADSSINIKNGDACFSEKGKQIVKAIDGDGPRDEKALGKGVYKRYGIGKYGFNIISNQFSIHYFFKNRNTFYNFIRNLSENCKVGGLCIGTCYDGKKVFKMLERKTINESVFIKNENHTKMWDLKKLYTKTTFPDDVESTLINVEFNLPKFDIVVSCTDWSKKSEALGNTDSLRVEISSLELKAIKSTYLPVVQLTGSYGWNENINTNPYGLYNKFVQTGTVYGGVDITLPIFNGGKRITATKNARLNLENSLIQKNKNELEIGKNLRNAYETYKNNLFLLQIQEKSLQTSKLSFSKFEEKYSLGLVSSLEFRQAQTNLLRAELLFNSSIFETKISELIFLKLSGEIVSNY